MVTNKGVGQAGSRRPCGSHSLVASLIHSDQWLSILKTFLQHSSHSVTVIM